MPIMDTYTTTTAGSTRRRRSRAMGEGEDLTASSRPVPAGRDYTSGSSSRPQDGSARRASRHHSRPRRHRSSRSSADGSHHSSDSSSNQHKSREEATKPAVPCQEHELYDFFKDTKIEMMRIVDADLKLKTDVRQIKESFFNLIKNFEAFEQRNPEYEIKATLEQEPKGRLYRRQRSQERRRKSHSRHARRYASELSSMRSSMASSVSQQCPNNTKVSPDKDTWASLLGSNDTAELPANQYSRGVTSESLLSEQGVENISSITRCSNVTYREQVSQSHIIDLPGPLSSTISYPQYSTPEKQMRLSRIEEHDADLPRSCTRKLNMDAPRPRPTGIDNVHTNKIIYNSTDSDATPVVVQRSRPVSDRVPTINEDSGLFCADTPSTVVTEQSQHYFMSGSDHNTSSQDQATPVAKRQVTESDVMDSKLRRQTAQPCLSGEELRSPVGLSETDLIDPSSFFEQTVTDIQCSMNATRASVANISSLSISPTNTDHSDGTPPSSDVTMSTGVESSYKESDATSSSSPPYPRPTSVKHSRSAKRHYSRHLVSKRMSTTSGRALSQCTSATSTSSYGGMIAPSNSPNMTGESTAARLVRKPPVNIIDIETIGLGNRPPCIGSDSGRLPPLPSSARAMSDPEGLVSSVKASRSARRAEQVSGTSSTGSTCASDKSVSSLESSKGSKGSGQEIAITPARKSVRRSFSKKIMNLGKLLRGGSSKSKSAEEQHSV